MENKPEYFMKKAIKLSLDNIENGGGPFGAVIVKDGEIISESANSVTKDNDPTAHAEINTIRLAAKKLSSFDLSGCEIYTSCEPCPMCLSAIYWARIDKIYYANNQNDAAKIGFDDEYLYNELNKTKENRNIKLVQLMRDEAIKAFNKWNEFENKTKY